MKNAIFVTANGQKLPKILIGYNIDPVLHFGTFSPVQTGTLQLFPGQALLSRLEYTHTGILTYVDEVLQISTIQRLDTYISW
jgi:hypothetical protein